MWTKIARKILRQRIALLISIVLFTAFMGYQASFVEMEYEYASMLPEVDTAYIEYQEFKKLFGEDSNVLIIGFQDDDFFQIDKYKDWVALCDKIKDIDGVLNVASITNTVNLKRNSELKKFEVDKIFPANINTQQELDSVKSIFGTLSFYKGVVYNDSTNAYILAVTIAKKKINSAARVVMMNDLQGATEEFAIKHNLDLHYSGLPYTRTRVAEMIKGELRMFTFLAMFVTAFILFLFFRSFKVVTFAMIIVGIGVVWALGSLQLFGFKITILTGMIPPLLIVIGIPNCVFLLNKYHNEYRLHQNKIKALQRIINKIGKATFLTNLTTALGFFTFIFTDSRILVEFGIVASINIMGIFLLSILLIPIIFSFLPSPKDRHVKHLDYKMIGRATEKLSFIVQHHRKLIYFVTSLLIICAIYGVWQLESKAFIVDDIPKDNPIYEDLKFLEKHADGVMPLEITINTNKKKGIFKYSTIYKINKLQEILKTYSEISTSTSLVDGLKFARQSYFGGGEDNYKLPDKQEITFILSYLPKDKETDNNKGVNLLKSFIDEDKQITRISMRAKDIGSIAMNTLRTNLRNDIDEIFPPNKYKTSITGSSVIYTKGIKYLIKNMFTSLAIAIVLISIIMATMFNSWKMIIVSLVPNFLPILFTAAIMGYFGIPLKPSTILVFSISYGISVDGAIHFLAKYRQGLTETDWNIKESVLGSIKEAGVSMIYTYIILFFGFLIFAFSDFGGTAALGLLVAITLLIALLSNLILLPSFLMTLERLMMKKIAKKEVQNVQTENATGVSK